MIPEGWKQASLQDVAPVIDCKHKTPRYTAQGVPIVSPGNLAWGALKLDGCRTISDADHAEMMDHCSVSIGDVVFGRNQSVGVSSIVTNDRPFALGQDTVLIKPKSISTGFLHQWLQSRQFELSILRLQGGSTFGRINLKDLRAVPTPVPPPGEADCIAETLQTWDRAIETVEALIANACGQKQALMQQLLSGKRRLPGFSEPWEWASFADVFGRVRTKNADGNTNVLTISAQHGLISQVEYFNKTVASDDVRSYTLLQRGDFAYNKSYSDGYPMGAIKPLHRYESGIVSSLYICFRLTKRGFNHDFFRHYFEAGLFNREIAAIAQEGARNHGLLNVSVVEFFETSLHIPKLDEQGAIAKVINAAEAEQKAYEAQLAALRQEKAALMQQLLTGKRRVVLPESEMAHA